jgi:predicted  nucleic acid-binding Zn-ribbon protein
MKCSICNQCGHNKRSCKKMNTPVSASNIEAETDVNRTLDVEIRMNIDSQIRETLESNNHNSKQYHFDTLRSKYPCLERCSNEELEDISNTVNSHSQSIRCKNGGNFEKIIEDLLQKKNIAYSRQVPIDKNGILVKKKKNNKVLDIIIGNAVIGQHISNYIVISLKTSTRERHSEDDWSKIHVPKLYLYGTLSSDYPHPEKFEESDVRKMLCLNPKKNDTRKFKLGFNDLYDLVHE